MTINDKTYFDLGKYERREITTTSADAKMWVDRGLVWLYAYNHEEAISCFEKALKSDESCVMAHWGIAYCVGPNYNYPWDDLDDTEKRDILRRATQHLCQIRNTINDEKISLLDVEKDLVKALLLRYPNSLEDDPEAAERIMGSFESFHDAYADAMRKVYKQHPKDLDVCSLTAEALMARTPWKLWDLPTGQPADGADTVDARAILEKAFGKEEEAWRHPGLLHMYTHLMEMSPTPEVALRHGDSMVDLVPDAGHLIHMGTHIDVLTGDYQNVVTRNQKGIEADNRFVEKGGADNFYSLYRLHNYHFKIYGAMFLAQPTVALDAANELMGSVPEGVLRSMADWFEAFMPMKQHVLVRFGMWNQILEQEFPEDKGLYCFTFALMRYARTIALANLKDIEAAEKERKLFLEAKDAVPSSRMLFNNTCSDVLDVAYHMMMGELEYHKFNFETAFDYLRKAIRLSDDMPYDEPWGWMQPVRHALGALLLEQKQYEEAESVYREDLGLVPTLARACHHPNNVWSLHGLYECLLHREEKVESVHVKQLLDKAQARAETPIHASCYCRRQEVSSETVDAQLNSTNGAGAASPCCGGDQRAVVASK